MMTESSRIIDTSVAERVRSKFEKKMLQL